MDKKGVAFFSPGDSESEIDLGSSKVRGISLLNKRARYEIIEGECDVTPVNLLSNYFTNMDFEQTHQAFTPKAKLRSEAFLGRSKSSQLVESEVKNYRTYFDLEDIKINTAINTETGVYEEEDDLDAPPSAFRLKLYPAPEKYPKEIIVVLKETETVPLFELPSYSFTKGTTEAEIIEEENELYVYLTVGKGRNRKTILAEAQTRPTMTQSRYCLKDKPEKKNASTFASVWDMHDTYALLEAEKHEQVEDEMVLFKTADVSLLRKKARVTKTRIEKRVYNTVEELLELPKFRIAISIMERLLSSFAYKQQQRKFRGLIEMNPLSLDLKYQYTFNLLWIYTCEETKQLCLMCCVFNPMNTNIIACGYGKFYYAERKRGLVTIWSTMNQKMPERVYDFDSPVNCLQFSMVNPNWLLCGLYNGQVLLLDITSFVKNVIAISQRIYNPSFEPVWALMVIFRKLINQEAYLVFGEDGRIKKFILNQTQRLICKPLLRVGRVEGNLSGVQVAHQCIMHGIPIKRYSAVLCAVRHPNQERELFVIGTDEGCLHKCSTHKISQNIDVIRAHSGPVYDIVFSQQWKQLYVTCGADWYARFWLDGINKPVLVIKCFGAIYAVSLCPKNETILVTASENVLRVWDIRRKIYEPSSEYKFPAGTTLTFAKFSECGNCVYVGASDGKLYTFFLDDMPIPPFNQEVVLRNTIKKIVMVDPNLLKEVEKLDERSRKRLD